MKVKALKAFTLRNADTGELTSIACGAVAEVDSTLGNTLISDGLAEAYTLVTPTGTLTIESNDTYDVTNYASATVEVIPTETITISANDTYDVTNYASAVVDVTPTGTITITANDTYDVTDYASAVVDVTPTGTITITANDTYDVTDYASAVVDVNPNTVTTVTGTIANPWGTNSYTDLLEEAIANGVSLKLYADVSAIAPGSAINAFLVSYSVDNFTVCSGAVITDVSSKAYHIEWDETGALHHAYMVMDGTITSVMAYADSITTTLTIIRHPLAD